MIQLQKRFFYFELLSFLMAFIGCSNEIPTAGGVETTNNVVYFKVVYSNGKVASAISVKVRPYDYKAFTNDSSSEKVQDLQTDEYGRVKIELIGGDDFFIEINDNNSYASLLKLNANSYTSDTTLSDEVLLPHATISGFLDTSIENNGSLYVQIEGLERIKAVSPQGNFLFDDLPQGVYTIQVVSANNSFQTIELPEVKVVSDKTTEIIVNKDGLLYEKPITINTTATGANISETLYKYPLLVRLDSSNFDFSATNPKELQFVNSSGKTLFYSVENWDAAKQLANIWVEVDTVAALGLTKIAIQWGQLNVNLNSEKVFTTDNGYSGVWHLNNVNEIVSSTNDQDRGDNFGCSQIDGVIGNAFNFENQSYATLKPEAFSSLQNEVTVSLWQYGINLDSIGNVTIFDARRSEEKDTTLLRCHLPWKVGTAVGATIRYRIYWEAGYSSISTDNANSIYKNGDSSDYQGQWNNWSFTKNSVTGDMKMFLNGELWYSDTGNYSSMAGIGAFKFGDMKDYQNLPNNYEGYLDEFRVSHIVRSESWIKMNYETQKIGSSVVKVGGK